MALKPKIDRFGSWEIEWNKPYGFVVRNLVHKGHEYHFYKDSNSWITCRDITDPKNPIVVPYGFKGFVGAIPVLCDSESIKKDLRLQELQEKAKSKSGLTSKEKDELLKLSGLIQ